MALLAKAARRAVARGGRESLATLCAAACQVGRATGAGIFIWKGREVSCLASVRLGQLRLRALAPELAPMGRLRRALRQCPSVLAAQDHRVIPLRVEGHVIGALYLEFPDHDEEIDALLCGLADLAASVVERERAEASVRAAQNKERKELYQLRASTRAQKRAARRLAHDLKTPLVALKGYVDMMKRGMGGPLTEAQTRYLSRMSQAVERQCAIIDDALAPLPTGCDLVAEAQAVLAELRRSADKMDILLELEAPDSLQVDAQNGEMALLIHDLLTGALEAAPRHSRLVLAIAQTPQGAQLQLAMEEPPEANARLRRCAALARRMHGRLHVEANSSGAKVSVQLRGGDVAEPAVAPRLEPSAVGQAG